MKDKTVSIEALALQRSRYKHLSDSEWQWFLQQTEGRQRTADKLPSFAEIEDWWYPVRLSCEQCSSELTARYKASVISPLTSQTSSFLDLTGGYGVDTYFLSGHFAHTDYVEQNAELCRIAEHNFNIPENSVQDTTETQRGKRKIVVHNCTAEEFLRSLPNTPSGAFSLVFIDPARRDRNGGKVFRLADCTPDVTQLLPDLLNHLEPEGRIMLKLSPMIDISMATKELAPIQWDVHVVAVKNEVKEVLMVGKKEQSGSVSEQRVLDGLRSLRITAIDLAEPEKAFVFTREEEQAAIPSLVLYTAWSSCSFLYEPNAAILKAGAYKLVAQRFGLLKMDTNTHLYCSDRLIPDFPGRIWKLISPVSNRQIPVTNANILCRNYPLTPDQLKKKLRLRDGGTAFIIACRVAGKPVLLLAERV